MEDSSSDDSDYDSDDSDHDSIDESLCSSDDDTITSGGSNDGEEELDALASEYPRLNKLGIALDLSNKKNNDFVKKIS